LPHFPFFWQYAEMRTNALVGCCGFLLSRGNKIHAMSETDQRSLKALASLKLTPREAEVLFWISEGKSNQDIGVILGASTGTICKHVEHILSKLNVENRTAAAVIALETSWSLAQRSEIRLGRSQAALAVFVAQQLSELWTDGCEIYNAITALIA
jgi:DNA-binding CsgD family transcriptional regulator